MPTYQYACTACDERLEAVQSFTDAPLTSCPACGGALRKVFSAVGVVFKGSGFYKTDSRGAKGADAKAEKADGTSETKAGSSDKAATSTASSKDGSSSSSASSSSSTPAAAAPASKSA